MKVSKCSQKRSSLTYIILCRLLSESATLKCTTKDYAVLWGTSCEHIRTHVEHGGLEC